MAERIHLRPAIEHLRRIELSSPAPEPQGASNPTFFPLQAAHYDELVERIGRILDSNLVPTFYRRTLVEPFSQVLKESGQEWFEGELSKDEIQKIVDAILQNFDSIEEGGDFRPKTEAIREVISDFYLQLTQSSTDRALCPALLSHWTDEDQATRSSLDPDLHLDIDILSLPLRFALRPSIAWGCLGHGIVVHDILKTCGGALKELKNQVGLSLKKNHCAFLKPYWDQWFEEGIADILGVLHMGSAAAFSLIGSLRAQSDTFCLSPHQYVNDGHSIDLVRGFIVAEALKVLNPEGGNFVEQVMEEVSRDAEGVVQLKWEIVMLGDLKKLPLILSSFYEKKKLDPPRFTDTVCQARELIENLLWKSKFVKFLASKKIPQTKKEAMGSKFQNMICQENSLGDFRKSARQFVEIVLKTQLRALGNRSFLEMRAWSEKDEKISNMFRMFLKLPPELDPVATFKPGFFASHIVSAAVMESITMRGEEPITETKLQALFERMVTLLQTLHRTNPQWQLPPEELSRSTSSTEFEIETSS